MNIYLDTIVFKNCLNKGSARRLTRSISCLPPPLRRTRVVYIQSHLNYIIQGKILESTREVTGGTKNREGERKEVASLTGIDLKQGVTSQCTKDWVRDFQSPTSPWQNSAILVKREALNPSNTWNLTWRVRTPLDRTTPGRELLLGSTPFWHLSIFKFILWKPYAVQDPETLKLGHYRNSSCCCWDRGLKPGVLLQLGLESEQGLGSSGCEASTARIWDKDARGA